MGKMWARRPRVTPERMQELAKIERQMKRAKKLAKKKKKK